MKSDVLYCSLQKDISTRVNVMTRKTDKGKIIIIYDDHRWILNVLFALFKHEFHPDLVYFDAHDDAAKCDKKSKLLERIGVEKLKDATAKQFGAFVDYNIGVDDGDWLTVAMELDLIGNAVNIGNRHNTNIKQLSDDRYLSEDCSPHNVFELSGNLEFELGCRGKLGDSCKEDEYRKLRDYFGIEHHYVDCHSLSISQPYILDFDLDFFTITDNNDYTHGWTEKVFGRHFPYQSKQDCFLKKLINDAVLITICREPDCCGSIGDSNRILQLLDYYYFNGCIGSSTTL